MAQAICSTLVWKGRDWTGPVFLVGFSYFSTLVIGGLYYVGQREDPALWFKLLFMPFAVAVVFWALFVAGCCVFWFGWLAWPRKVGDE